MALAAALPFCVTALPQMGDYPSHLAAWRVMIDGGKDSFLAQYYAFEWRLTGNLGAELLIRPLAVLFGLEPAGRLLGAMIALLTGLGVLSVEWALRRRIGAGSMLAMMMIWSPSFGTGFYNFSLSLALALLAFALWIRLEGWSRRWALFLPIGLAVWLCHIAGWGVLGVLILGYELHRKPSLQALWRPWPLLLPLIPLLTGPKTGGLISYGNNVFDYKAAIWVKAMQLNNAQLDLISLLLVLSAVLFALRGKRLDGQIALAAGMFAVLTLIVPRHVFGGDYADMRLVPVALMAACLAIDWPLPRWATYCTALPFLIRLAVTTHSWQVSGREMEQMLQALNHLPRGAKVAGAEASDPFAWQLDPFEHVFSYALVRREALVNSLFALPQVHMLKIKQGGPGFVDPAQRIQRFPGDPPLDLSAFKPAQQADYLWYYGSKKPVRTPEGMQIIYRSGNSFLARLANDDKHR